MLSDAEKQKVRKPMFMHPPACLSGCTFYIRQWHLQPAYTVCTMSTKRYQWHGRHLHLLYVTVTIPIPGQTAQNGTILLTTLSTL